MRIFVIRDDDEVIHACIANDSQATGVEERLRARCIDLDYRVESLHAADVAQVMASLELELRRVREDRGGPKCYE